MSNLFTCYFNLFYSDSLSLSHLILSPMRCISSPWSGMDYNLQTTKPHFPINKKIISNISPNFLFCFLRNLSSFVPLLVLLLNDKCSSEKQSTDQKFHHRPSTGLWAMAYHRYSSIFHEKGFFCLPKLLAES